MGAERLDDVGKTVLDAEDRVFDLETPNFWHKQGGRERNPLRPCRPAAPVPDPPYDLHEPPKSRYRRQLPGQAGPSQSRTPFRQVLPAPEGNSRQVLLSGRGRQTFVGAPSRRDNHPKNRPVLTIMLLRGSTPRLGILSLFFPLLLGIPEGS